MSTLVSALVTAWASGSNMESAKDIPVTTASAMPTESEKAKASVMERVSAMDRAKAGATGKAWASGSNMESAKDMDSVMATAWATAQAASYKIVSAIPQKWRPTRSSLQDRKQSPPVLCPRK
jgi:hypothetical protein